MINYIILVPMVYVAFSVFFLGVIVRIISVLRRPALVPHAHIYPKKRPTWFWALYDTFLLPMVRKHNPVLWCFLMVFHICFFLLIIGHLELIQDFKIFQIIEHEVFLGGGVIGLLLSLSIMFFLFRRFVEPAKDLSVPEDYYLLILIFLTAIFGSQMDWARTLYYYEEMGVDAYRAYLMSLLTFKPEIGDLTLSGHSFMLILHVFFANLFLMFFPFSKIMHSFFAIPLNKLRRG